MRISVLQRPSTGPEVDHELLLAVEAGEGDVLAVESGEREGGGGLIDEFRLVAPVVDGGFELFGAPGDEDGEGDEKGQGDPADGRESRSHEGKVYTVVPFAAG